MVVGSIVAGRVGFEQLGQAFASRYFIYTKCLWLFALILIVNCRVIGNKTLLVLLGISILFYSNSYNDEVRCLSHHQERLHNSLNAFLFEGDNSSLAYPNKKAAEITIRRAIDRGYYQPKFEASTSTKITDGVFNVDQTITQHLDVASRINNFLYLRGWSFKNGLSTAHTEMKLGISPIEMSEPLFIITPTITKRIDVHDIHSKDQVDLSSSGYHCIIDLESLSLENLSNVYVIIDESIVNITAQMNLKLQEQEE